MRLLLPISISLLLAWQSAGAQTADDFFNGGAQFYISNNIPAALDKTESGLKLYPNDVKLQKLEKLLKQQQQSQSQQNQQQQQNQQSQSQQQKNQQNQQQNQQSQNQSGQQRQNQQPPQNPQQKNQSGQSGNEQQPQQAQGNEMTPEQAKQLLDSQKNNEQVLQFSPKGKPQNENQTIKDW
ncbi:MAG TPA: hypothetical protein VMB22_02085 [Verrucomicrobiae bacterium]|nr:hypothetical protein [Verrucomicrobiae bacterium]